VGFGIEYLADLSGEWTLTMDPDFRGNPATSDCSIKQTDHNLSVRCRGGAEMLGTVKQDEVTWGFSAPPGEKHPSATWIGAVGPSRDAIEGTWHLSIVGGDLDGKFSATKKKSGQAR
jgi:hypothetical protein